jgi:Type II secretion system protein C
MSRRIIALNVLIGLVVVGLAVLLAREMAVRRSLPPPSARPAAPASGSPAGEQAAAAPGRGDSIAAYGVIASRNLFTATRSEAPPPQAAPPPPPPAPKPILHGVIVDEVKSRAWLEDPATKRTFGYTVGDTVGGGRLERIAADRVVIARPEGAVEVLLRDPSKPRPAAAPAGPPAPARPPARATAPGVAPGGAVPLPSPAPTAEGPPPTPAGQPPAPPPLLRRPAVGTPPAQTPPAQPAQTPPAQNDDE